MRKLYETNDGFRQYVDKYCVKHEIDRETAFTHSVIRNAYEYYLHVNDGKISVTEVNAGCGAASGGDCK